MHAPAATRLSVLELLCAVRHVAAWVDYRAGGGPANSTRAAKLTYYVS